MGDPGLPPWVSCGDFCRVRQGCWDKWMCVPETSCLEEWSVATVPPNTDTLCQGWCSLL
jgi:hypothetical protein